ncbi:MAG: hypothetical protein J7L14_01405, partial [Candidatus Diapherotrites archaeon]|nr:hypothetical protein [Candidatus Diapherotrites archaeon]
MENLILAIIFGFSFFGSAPIGYVMLRLSRPIVRNLSAAEKLGLATVFGGIFTILAAAIAYFLNFDLLKNIALGFSFSFATLSSALIVMRVITVKKLKRKTTVSVPKEVYLKQISPKLSLELAKTKTKEKVKAKEEKIDKEKAEAKKAKVEKKAVEETKKIEREEDKKEEKKEEIFKRIEEEWQKLRRKSRTEPRVIENPLLRELKERVIGKEPEKKQGEKTIEEHKAKIVGVLRPVFGSEKKQEEKATISEHERKKQIQEILNKIKKLREEEIRKQREAEEKKKEILSRIPRR